jgi:hypothetical protein
MSGRWWEGWEINRYRKVTRKGRNIIKGTGREEEMGGGGELLSASHPVAAAAQHGLRECEGGGRDLCSHSIP